MVSSKTSKKTPLKKVKARKKAVPQTNVKMSLPSAEFTADLSEVFKRHGWSGLPQQLSFSSDAVCDRVCGDGSIAQPKWIECPGGMKMVCACPGEDPTCQDRLYRESESLELSGKQPGEVMVRKSVRRHRSMLVSHLRRDVPPVKDSWNALGMQTAP